MATGWFLFCGILIIIFIEKYESIIASDSYMELYLRTRLANASTEDIYRFSLVQMEMRSLSIPSYAEFVLLLGQAILDRAMGLRHLIGAIESETWNDNMLSLLAMEQNPYFASEFYNYYNHGYEPRIFHWPNHGSEYLASMSVTLLNDPLALAYWMPAMLAGSRYGVFHPNVISVSIPLIESLPFSVRAERVQHLFHIFVLHLSTGMLVQDIKQIIEFGGGTGDQAVLVRELRFQGVYFIFDFPPMILLQQYFLSFHHWPAYIGSLGNISEIEAGLDEEQVYDDIRMRRNDDHGVPVDFDLKGRQTILESNMTHLMRHYQYQYQNETMFWATFSLSEASLSTRNQILNNAMNYGYIFIAAQDIFEDIKNIPWLVSYAQGLYDYHVCVWDQKSSSVISNTLWSTVYLVARKKELGPIICSEKAGCTESTMYYNSV